MTDLQITVAFVVLALGVVAAALASWGISGLFPTNAKTPAGDTVDEDYAAKLTRKNLASKHTRKGG